MQPTLASGIVSWAIFVARALATSSWWIAWYRSVGDSCSLGEVIAPHEWLVQHRVDLVEGQPVLHLGAVSVEQGPRVALVEPDEVPADPAVVVLCERQRCLVVGDRHQRLDAVLGELVEHG